MPGKQTPPASNGGWVPPTDPTKLTTDAVNNAVGYLREFYDLRFEQLDLRLEQRFQAQSKALDAALDSADRRAAAMADRIDELRSRYYETAGREMAVPNIAQQVQALTEKVDQLRILTTRGEGADAALGIPETLRAIQAQIDANSKMIVSEGGRTQGLNAAWGYLIGAVGLAATVIAIVSALAR